MRLEVFIGVYYQLDEAPDLQAGWIRLGDRRDRVRREGDWRSLYHTAEKCELSFSFLLLVRGKGEVFLAKEVRRRTEAWVRALEVKGGVSTGPASTVLRGYQMFLPPVIPRVSSSIQHRPGLNNQ